jgi:rubrerythrin
MLDIIEENLSKAFAEESKAAVKNDAYALKADREGRPELARLFRAVADADAVHARRFLFLMRGKIGTTKQSLRAACEQESKSADNEYPPMVEASGQGSTAVKKAFRQSMMTDREHWALFREAIGEDGAETDIEYYVCQICGHTSKDVLPENCPVCHAVCGRFKKIA